MNRQSRIPITRGFLARDAIASSGLVRAARSAGHTPPATPEPTAPTTAAITPVHDHANPAGNCSGKSRTITYAASSPRGTPIIDPSTPITPPTTSCDSASCERDPPMHRTTASSR